MKNYQQGRGIEKNVPEEKKEEKTFLENIKSGIKNFFMTAFWAALIVAAESIAIWWIWNYVIPEHPLTYTKIFLLIVMIRLIFRSNINFGQKK